MKIQDYEFPFMEGLATNNINAEIDTIFSSTDARNCLSIELKRLFITKFLYASIVEALKFPTD